MRIRLTILTAAIAAFILSVPQSTSAQPQPKSFGFGIILGEPTGLTLKGDLGGNNSWDAGIGSSWYGRLSVHADYLWAANVFNSRKAGLYFGLGGVVGIGRGNSFIYKGAKWYVDDDQTRIAVRGSVGVNFMPFTAPVEIFGEIAPLISLTPVSGLGWYTALGIRYYP